MPASPARRSPPSSPRRPGSCSASSSRDGWPRAACGVPRATLFDRAKLVRMLAVNRDIMIRTAALIAAFLFFTAQGARAGDVTLAANAVLNNFLLISAFFLDGLANAAEQLCGRAYGARDRDGVLRRGPAGVVLGFGFALAVTAIFALFGPGADRSHDRERGGPAARARLSGLRRAGAAARRCSPSPMTASIIGATWARDMRNLMVLSLLIFLAAWLALRAVRQCRAVGCAAGALCRARRLAGAALSVAAQDRRSDRGHITRPASPPP